MKQACTLALVAFLLLSSLVGSVKAQDLGVAAPDKCALLVHGDFTRIAEAPTQITEAQFAESTGNLPDYCRVVGYVSPRVGFELRLPKSWNGKFLEVGCGGHCGSLATPACNNALRRGYACLASDMGHKGSGLDGVWAQNDLQAKMDWGYRATHVAALAGKAIVEQYYARHPKNSYFVGCSTGGRQGLQEAQRFPWDFDGIIAGAPPIHLSELYVTFAWSALATIDAAGKDLLTQSDLDHLSAAAVADCDMDDGVRDGIISQPLNCRFRPEELACKKGSAAGCLNPMQVAAAQKIYSGPVDSAGQPMFGGGALPGSESGWSKYYLDDRQGQRPYMFPLTNNGMRYLFSSPELDADWSIEKFQFDSDYKRMDVMQALYDSSNPDLTRFRATGAKLIIYMGMNDISIPRSVINYYLKVERVMGGQEETRSFARLYLLPGVDHCGGGPGADTVDYLGYLEDWVERGTAPDRLVAYHLKGSNGATALESYPPSPQVVEFSRPVYPYPAFAKYSGHGDPKDANSFGPSEP